MQAWFASGGAAAVVLAGMAAEAAVLAGLYWRAGVGVRPGLLLPNLGAGGCLVGAAGVAMGGGWWGWVSGLLLGGLLLHLVDLSGRWTGGRG